MCITEPIEEEGIEWKIVHGSEFQDFNHVLDKVMQERSARMIGTVRKQAQVISLEYENRLWDTNILGEDTPDKLRDTVLYLLGVNCALRAGDEHYNLRRPSNLWKSQLSFENNEFGIRCLVYHEDTVTKTNKGGLHDMKKERKIVWVKPNSNWQRCPVRIVEKYLRLLPFECNAKKNLYLQSLKKPRPYCWYSTMPVGINKVRKVVSSMLKQARLDGFFTNHSLHRTCATRLFQAGESVKVVKEITGHISDAVHKYQTTSDAQKMHVSDIIHGNVKPINLSQAPQMELVPAVKPVSNEEKFKLEPLKLKVDSKNECTFDDNSCMYEGSKIENVIGAAVKAVGKRKAKMTIQIEFDD